jgi:excisionase family DNA binding protein
MIHVQNSENSELHVVPDIGPALLVTVEEAASLLRLGRTRCYQLVMAGHIQSVKVGRRRLVVRASLEEFIIQLLREQTLA